MGPVLGIVGTPLTYFWIMVGIWVFWVWGEVRLRGFNLVSFPILAGPIFFIGQLGVCIEQLVGVEYNHFLFVESYYLPATYYTTLCFIFIVIGYRLRDLFGVHKIRVQSASFKIRPLFMLAAWVFLVLTIVSRITTLGFILYSSERRYADAWIEHSVFDKILYLLTAFSPPFGALLAAFGGSRPPRLANISWIIFGASFFFDLITFSRATTLNTAAIILAFILVFNLRPSNRHEYLENRRYTLRAGVLLLSAIGILVGLRLAYDHSDIRTQGLFSVIEVYNRATENRSSFGDTGTNRLPLPPGGIRLQTAVMDLNSRGITRPWTDFLFNINPLPSFFISDESTWWFTRAKNLYGSTGVPLTLPTELYSCFGWWGSIFFIGVGYLANRLWLTALCHVRFTKGLIPFSGVMYYVIGVAGFWFCMAHQPLRPAFRLFVNTFLVLVVIRFFSPHLWKTSNFQVRSDARILLPKRDSPIHTPMNQVAPTQDQPPNLPSAMPIPPPPTEPPPPLGHADRG